MAKRVATYLDDEHEAMWPALVEHYEGQPESYILRTLVRRKFYAIQDGDTTEARLQRIEDVVNENKERLQRLEEKSNA